jgi:hypothetical protein
VLTHWEKTGANALRLMSWTLRVIAIERELPGIATRESRGEQNAIGLMSNSRSMRLLIEARDVFACQSVMDQFGLGRYA